MPYGSGQRLGETIDPRFMQADYSGFTNAAAITGNAFANIGQQIGDTIKKRNENEKEIAGGIKMATAMKKAVPALGSMADEVIDNLSNADLSTNDKLLALAGVKEAMQMSLLGNQERRADVALKIQQDELAAKIAAAGNKSPQGTFMTTQEFSSLMNSGVPVKGVPMPDGRIFVTDISGNQPGILGSGVAMVDGKPTKVPTTPVNLPAWGGGGNYSNPNDGRDASTMTDEEIIAMAAGVSADGTPGFLPPLQGTAQQSPYVQRVINDVNNGFTFGTRTGATVTPPPSQAAASVANGFSMIPPTAVPTGDVYKLQGGQVGVTRLPGSSAELDYQTKLADLEKSKLEAEKIKGETEKTSKESTKAKNNFSTVIEEATDAYSNLYKKGGAVVGGQFSLGQVLASTNAGQKFGEITGSEAQLFRNYLDSLAPKILLGIMASTGLSATQLNSNAELQLQLKSLGDPSKPIQSNIAALDTLDKMYGDGTSVSKMLSKNPKLGALMKESGFDYGKKEASGDTELDSIMEEVKQMREKMGVQ